MGKVLMIQGTCSGAGKSLLVSGLARIFADRGMRVAPFKSQNMALNSFITREGAEIGRAQALQARAARIEPSADMNPILLKATGEKGCQVILHGKAHSNMTAREYYAFRHTAWPYVTSSLERLRDAFDLVVIEGAGSPAEINLKDEEIVNMRVARHADAPVLLVGDIERGGVFASFYGTVALLEEDAKLIKGFIINKFRGDRDILDPGIRMIEGRTGISSFGILPWMKNPGLDEEDGLGLRPESPRHGEGKLRVVVVRLGFISNFTDFDALAMEPDVELAFSADPGVIQSADLVIIPGSKNTVKDLLALRQDGLDLSIASAAAKGVPVIGICGGYQMMGKRIADPLGVESPIPEVKGLGLLDIETEMHGEKITAQTEARTSLYGYSGVLRGYEIHMGRTHGDTGLFSFTRLHDGTPASDGSIKGNVWGTYLHGIFDSDGFRHAMLNKIRALKGLPSPAQAVSFEAQKEQSIADWARFVERHLDMGRIEGLIS